MELSEHSTRIDIGIEIKAIFGGEKGQSTVHLDVPEGPADRQSKV